MKIYKPANYSYITVCEIPKLEIQKFDMALCAQPRQTLKSFYNKCPVKPALICNGGFFNMSNGDTVFTYTDEGKIISQDPRYVEGMGTINGELVAGSVNEHNYTDFICGYPVLIKNGKKAPIKIASEINYNARRTVLAYNADKVYIIAIESPGMTFAAMQNFLLSLGVTNAINLDGGGSTKILYNGNSLTSSAYNRAVDNVIAVYLKPQSLYRVQLGCFGLKANAEKMLKRVQALGGVYQKAYVRKIGQYYKVQCGAFSVRTNAVNMVNDLKSKGFDAFVTI